MTMQAAPTFCAFCKHPGVQGQAAHLFCFGVGDIVMRADDGHAVPGLITGTANDMSEDGCMLLVEWMHPRQHRWERTTALRFVRKG